MPLRPFKPSFAAPRRGRSGRSLGGGCGRYVLVLASAYLGASVARAEVSSSVPRALLESFPFQPVTEEVRLESAPLGLVSDVKTEAEVVTLPSFEVQSRLLDRRVAAGIERARPLTPQTHTVLGTGIRERDFGKVRGHVVTILFVPVRFGISW